MRLLVILLALLAVYVSSVADPYRLFKEKGKIGMKDETGKVVIPASFDALGWSDGSFSVVGQVTGYKLQDQWGLINLRKEFLSKAEYESITYPGGDRVIAQKRINRVQSRVGCLDLRGNVAIPFLYDGIQIMGLRAIVFVKQGLLYTFGLIDLNGHEIIPLQYKSIYPLGTLRFAVENRQGKTALFSEEGHAITDFKIDSISSFRNNLAVVYQDMNQGLIDRDGSMKIQPEFLQIKIESDGSVWTRKHNQWKILSGENQELRHIEAEGLSPWWKNLYLISKGNRSGIANDEFKTVLSIDYRNLGALQDGNLIIAKKEKFGILRLDGSVLLPFQFDSLVWEGKLIRARRELFGKSSWTVYDTFGIQKTNQPYDVIGRLTGKNFPVMNHGYWGAVNRYGEEFIHCVFDSLLEISEEQFAVKYKGLYGVINASEDWLVTPQPYRVGLVNKDCYLLHSGRTVFLKDFAGRIIYFTDNPIDCRKEYMVETSADGTEKHIDYEGRIMERNSLPLVVSAEKLFPESEGLRGILKDGKFGFVDSRGRLRIANRYEGIGSFKEGLAPMKIMDRWGYIDTDEKIIIQPTYESAGEFSAGMALVKRSGKYGMIDPNGREVINIRYDSILSLPGGGFLLSLGGLQGLASKNGQVVMDTKYDRVEDMNNGYVIILRDGKFGLLTLQGISTIPLIYDQLIYNKAKNQYLALLRPAWKKWSASP